MVRHTSGNSHYCDHDPNASVGAEFRRSKLETYSRLIESIENAVS